MGSISSRPPASLKNRDQADGGVGYSYRYLFGDRSVEKQVTLRFNGSQDTVRIIEPVITLPGYHCGAAGMVAV